jgi:hypothetical protein
MECGQCQCRLKSKLLRMELLSRWVDSERREWRRCVELVAHSLD